MTHSVICRAMLCSVVLSAAATGCTGDPAAAAQHHAARADAYVQNRQFEEAIIEYGRALQLRPDAADVRFKLGRVHEDQGDLAKAHREFVRAADLDPANVDAQMKAGTALLSGGDFEGARGRATLALKADPHHVPALVLLGNALAGSKDTAAAITQIEQALALEPGAAPAWTALGAINFVRGHKAEAAAALQEAVRLAPNSIEPRLALANYYWASGALAESEESLKVALSLDPANGLTNRAFVSFYLVTDRAAAAEPHVRTLAVDAPGQLALADYLAALGRHHEARDVLVKLEGDPDNDVRHAARLRRARLLHAMGDRTEAHRLLDAMVDDAGRDVQVRVAKARMLLVEGAPPALAAEHARAAVAAAPRDPVTHYVLGLAQLAANDLSGAENSFEEVARINPRAPAAHLQLSRIRLASGDPGRAVTAAERVLREAPHDVAATTLLVRGLRAQGDLPGAAAKVDAALAKSSEAPSLHIEKGWIALARRDVSTAIASFETALQLSSDNMDARTGLVSTDLAHGTTAAARARVAGWRNGDPGSHELALLAAKVEIAAGRLADAAAILEGVAAAHPAKLEAHQMLGHIYAALGRTSEAVARFEMVAAQSPNTAARARTTVGMLHEGKDQAAARAAYEAALSADPNAAVAANNLAWIYAGEGRLPEALRLAKVAHDRLQRPESEHTLGWVYFQMGLTAQATSAFDSARRRAPNKALYHYHAGLAWIKAGDTARAEAALGAALSADAGFSDAQDAQAQLERLRATRAAKQP